MKNKLLTNVINKKDPILKEESDTNCNKYRNLLSILMKKVNSLITTDILKKIGKVLRTDGKELNPSFL